MTLWMIALGLSLVYVALQAQYILYWRKIKSVPGLPGQAKGVSILVVARNESGTIERCLKGLVEQDYPPDRIDILVIDDHSDDDTASIVRQVQDPRIRLLSLRDHPDFIHPPAYKKSAIALGVTRAMYDTILVTDADCTHSPAWIRTITGQLDISRAVFATGPVMLTAGKNNLGRMQEMEYLALMLITGSGIQSRLHAIASGANMAFRKSAFEAVQGYADNYRYASGDDMFLIEKMRDRYPDQIMFVKSLTAIVTTDPAPDWKALLKQRARWAGKNKGLRHPAISLIWGFVGAYHVFLVLAALGALLSFISSWPFLHLLFFKWASDYLLLQQAALFFNKRTLLRYFIPLQCLYSLYILRLGGSLLFGNKGDWAQRPDVR